MEITREIIDHLADLARLGLTEEEKQTLVPEIARILEYVSELGKVDTKAVRPLTGGTELGNVVRSDEPRALSVSPEELLSQAPSREHNYIKVPRILE